MNKNIEYLSREKFEELKKELDNLVTVKRKEITESLEFAKSLGDLSENAEYQEAREMQANVEQRILEIEKLLKEAVILSSGDKNIVGIGTTVVVSLGDKKETRELKIVGSEEADALSGKISNVSPLGSSLFGKKVGDVVSVTTPKGQTKYKIVELK